MDKRPVEQRGNALSGAERDRQDVQGTSGRHRRLGVDIGRVIIGGGAPGGGDTQFFSGDTARMLATPAVPGAFEALARLVPQFEEVWLVSKCGERVQRSTRLWLDHHRFAARTGIPRDHVRFCLRRPEKAVHCAELGITHFVDDKLDVHEALRGVVGKLCLFGPQRVAAPSWVQHTRTWADVEAAIGRPAGMHV